MRIRTFIAIELDEGIRRSAYEAARELGAYIGGVKWVEPENIHLTLKFLGDLSPDQVRQVCEVTTRVAGQAAPFEIRVEEVGTFPHAGNPRVIWVGVQGQTEPLLRLHEALETGLADLGFPRESKRFVPHVTLGRVRSTRDREALRQGLERLATWRGGEQMVDHLTVFSSQLRREGPIHTAMGHSPLAKGRADH